MTETKKETIIDVEKGIEVIKRKSLRPSFRVIVSHAIPFMENDRHVARMPISTEDGEVVNMDQFGIYATKVFTNAMGHAFPGLSRELWNAAYQALKIRYVKGSDLNANICGNGWKGTFEDLITEVQKSVEKELDRHPYMPIPVIPTSGDDI